MLFRSVHHETRLRRFLEAYEEEARKNGKSAKGSALLLYMLAADGEHGAECYTAATTRDQARIVFDDAKAMAERSPGLRTHLGVAIMQHSLTVAHTSSKAAPLAAEGSTLDGLNVHFALLDELHAHKTRAVYDVIDSARGADIVLAGQFGHLGANELGDFQRIGTGLQENTHGDGRLAVQRYALIVAVGAEFDAGDVLEAEQAVRAAGADDDVAELLLAQ